MKFDKTLNLDIDHPVTDREELVGTDVPQTFSTNMDPTQVYYLVIQSSHILQASEEVFDIHMNRTIRFRDPHGTAA
jgi:hypothetical protein